MVNDSVIDLNETFTMARGMNVVTVMDAHMCTWEETLDVVGMPVVRDTMINTYIGEETQFVDTEAGLDTMLAAGTYEFTYVVVECERTLNVTVEEIPRPYDISDIQGDGDTSPIEGQIAQITGTVTGISSGEGFFVQDAVAAWSGIWIEYQGVDTLGLAIGDGVTVVGEVAEIASVTSLMDAVVTTADNTTPITPLEVASPTDAKAEMYESVLIMVPGARATAAVDGVWTVYYEESDNVTVNNWLYTHETVVEGHFYDVAGIDNGRNDAYKLEPRMESDIVDLTETKVDPELANNFKVYPNPFNDKIYIDNNDLLTRVVITNIAGQRVIDVEYPEREIRTANLVSGVYLVNLFNESGLVKTDRIVKR